VPRLPQAVTNLAGFLRCLQKQCDGFRLQPTGSVHGHLSSVLPLSEALSLGGDSPSEIWREGKEGKKITTAETYHHVIRQQWSPFSFLLLYDVSSETLIFFARYVDVVAGINTRGVGVVKVKGIKGRPTKKKKKKKKKKEFSSTNLQVYILCSKNIYGLRSSDR
jgi:hypothetical protein